MRSVTRLSGTTDPWFLSRYGMNLYRGCVHGCLYCDGRAERYYVEGNFDRDIAIKVNAVTVLDQELARIREPGFLMLGGGVCDAYQPAEEKYGLARGVLGLALKHRLPVHILTKSALVERDLDLMQDINRDTQAILSFSVQTVNDSQRARFEPGAAPMSERFRILRLAKQMGLGVGVMAMPVLPGISDQPDAIEALVATSAQASTDFLCFGGLTLRPGVQAETFLSAIRKDHPSLLPGYERLYRQRRKSGAPEQAYLERVARRFVESLDRHQVPARIPRKLFHGKIPLYTELAVLLEHEESRRTNAGRHGGGLSRAGMSIQMWARGRFAAHRRKGFGFRQVEGEFQSMLRDGSMEQLPGMIEPAVGLMRKWLGQEA